MDGRIDGKFIIKKGGITQGIAKELGLTSAECKQISGSIWTQVINEFNNEQNMNVQNNRGETPNASNSYVVHENAVITFSKECWSKIVGLINSALGKNIQVEEAEDTTGAATAQATQTTTVQEVQTNSKVEPPPELKAGIDNAVTLIKSELNNLSEQELKTLNISAEKRDRLLRYIDNISYDDFDGSAYSTGSSIVLSTKYQEVDNVGSLIAILMHEANHCDETYLSQHPEYSDNNNYRFRDENSNPQNNRVCNSIEEEKSCETLGMLTVALLAKKGAIGDYSRYNNHSVKDYIDSKGNPTNLLKDDINQWVKVYSNLPTDLNGNLTVLHTNELNDDSINLTQEEKNQSIQIKSGDIVRVGNKEYTIGAGKFILASTIGNLPVFDINGQSDEPFASNIVFDDIVPNQSELDYMSTQTGNQDDKTLLNRGSIPVQIIRSGKVIYTGKSYIS